VTPLRSAQTTASRAQASLVVAALVALATLTLTACHDVTNPVDPRSTTYMGEQVLRDPPPPEPLLPPIERWETIAEHAPGQFLGLAIPEDGSLIDPRQPADPATFFVVMTFTEAVYPEDFEDAMVFIRISTSAGTTTELATVEIMPVYRQVVIRSEPPAPPFFPTLPDAATVRIRVVDPTGLTLGERAFGLLPGDFDGDGVVSVTSDWDSGALAYDGVLANEDHPVTVRADMDASGSTIAGPTGDRVIVDTNNGTTLPPPPAPF
jgi:hypothetical protein